MTQEKIDAILKENAHFASYMERAATIAEMRNEREHDSFWDADRVLIELLATALEREEDEE